MFLYIFTKKKSKTIKRIDYPKSENAALKKKMLG